ncbi:MAG: RNA-binding S4 domain-containing protein [Micropepsaceae bacterium]
MRLDKWLWCARFYKTRGLAAEICAAGRIRVNGQATDKAHYAVKIGDRLTLPQGSRVRVIEVLAHAERRGPATEAATLYAEHDA